MASGTGSLGCQFGMEPTVTIVTPAPYAGEKYLGQDSRYVTQPHPRTGAMIKGFKWDRRMWSKDDTENWDSYVEPLWDPTISGVSKSYFQSGIGDNVDLKLMDVIEVPSSGLYQQEMFRPWAPVVKHGFFYDFDEEYFLFSDASKTAFATYSGAVVGINRNLATSFNEIELSDFLKPGVIVRGRQWEYNRDTGEYDISIDFRKKASFTGLRDPVTLARAETFDSDRNCIWFPDVDKTDPEFMVMYSGTAASGFQTSFPTIVLNDQYVQQIGGATVPGSMYILGITQGDGAEVFQTTFSPIDRTMGIEVYTYLSDIAASSGQYVQWQGVSNEEDPIGYRVAVDYDMGTVRFGDPTYSGMGQVTPSGGHYVAARYWRTIELEYEPEHTTDLVTGTETNLNPIYRKGSQGFVHISPRDDNPASIILRAEEREISPDTFGPIYVGISYLPVVATVYNETGQVIEDETVRFEITSLPVMGLFSGGETTSTGVTDQNGEALAFYRPPRSIEEIAEVCTEDDMTTDNAPTIPDGATQTVTFRLDELALRGTESEVFLYSVMRDDLIQGDYYNTVGNTTTEQTIEYYKQFFSADGLYGPLGIETGGTEPSTNAVVWEAMRRMIWDLQRPTIFGVGSGRKTIVAFLDAEARNPHTLAAGCIYPFQPSVIESVDGGGFDIIYDTSTYTLDVPTGIDYLYGYMIVGPTLVKMKAYAYNERLRRNIYSNEITVNIGIPPYAKGVWEIELLNTVADDEISPLLTAVMEGDMVPFGWRIRSTNVTLAGAISAVTFLDKNQPYNSNVWGHDGISPVIDTLWNQFEVDEIV